MLEVLGFLGLLSAGARLKDREAGAEGTKATPSPGNMLMLGDGMSPLDCSRKHTYNMRRIMHGARYQ